MIESVNLAQLLLYCTNTVWSTNPVDSPLWCRGMASYRHIEQETGSSTPQVVERHSWYHLEGQSRMKKFGKILLEKVIRERSMRWLGHVTWVDEVRIPKQALHWKVAGFRRRPDRPRMNWRDVAKKTLQRMGLTWNGKRLKHHFRGVNMRPYASVMLDESSQVNASWWQWYLSWNK